MNNYFTRSSFGCAQYKHFVFPYLVDLGGTVRVTTLSGNTRDSDLQELFGPIGKIFHPKVCVFSYEYIPFADNVICFLSLGYEYRTVSWLCFHQVRAP